MQEVFPGEFGIPQRPWFLFTRAYWWGTAPLVAGGHAPSCLRGGGAKGNYKLLRGDAGELQGTMAAAAALLPEVEHPCPVVEVYGEGSAHVRLRNIGKTYRSGCGPCGDAGDVHAVSSLSLDVLEGQVTALLGHNGAGKTTLMSLLSGLFPVTSGMAMIYGSDIRHDIAGVRHNLGMCPQHNVLFGDLSAEEHLLFTARLKGLSWADAHAEAAKYLQDLALDKARHTLSRNLSGGMKRKLCVCMAFIGNSQLVILDEPTAGMDPRARRTCWDLLLKYKASRTILLSTHHMDEADLLGDRIAIMTTGVLRCVGSSLFLKRRFGAGYYLIVNTDGATCQPEALLAQLRKTTSNVVLHERKGADITFRLPVEDSPLFGDLLTSLERDKERLGVLGYGVSATTLEEVFLNVMSANAVNDAASGPLTTTHAAAAAIIPPTSTSTPAAEDTPGTIVLGDATSSTCSSLPSQTGVPLDGRRIIDGEVLAEAAGLQPPALSANSCRGREGGPAGGTSVVGGLLRLQRLTAMLQKRFWHAKRDRKALVSQILLPAAFVCIAMWVATAFPPVTAPPSLNLSYTMFNNACASKPQPNVVQLKADPVTPMARYARPLRLHTQ